MSKNPFAGALAILLTLTLATPTVFFIAPQRAQAQAGAIGCVSGVAAGLATLVGEQVKNVGATSATAAAGSAVTAGATLGSCVDDTILKPLARMLARIVLQQITASTINWINGGNGSGKASFVTNLSVNLQGVGDAVALPFINQIRTGFNSPFGSAISSALQINYNQQTSLAGFFAANQSTLARSSPNINSFLAGNWSQGGIPAWFALTTQDNNNPYTLYQAAQSQLGSTVGQAQTNRRADIAAGSGFLSFCSVSSAAANTQSAAVTAYQNCIGGAGGEDSAACSADYTAAGGAGSTAPSMGVKPGDSCTNSDGTPGTVQTPGSIIHGYTEKAVVGAGIDQLVSAQDLDQALGAIAMALVSQVLSGSGLLGASSPSSGSRPAITTQLQNYSAGNTAAAASANLLAQTTLSQLELYTSAWNAITAAANTASASIDTLVTYCNAQKTEPNASLTAINAQVAAAQTALATEIPPVLAQAQSAIRSASTAKAFALKVQSEAAAVTSLTSADTGVAGALSADVQTLTAMPPSATDVVTAQYNATATGFGATASPAGSLTVSRGSLVDQMNLISANAAALQSVCTPVVPVDSTSSGGG